MSKRIIIPTIGTRGDVQPYMALAVGLQKAGHPVTIASHPIIESLVTAHDVAFAPIGPDVNIGQEAARMRSRSRTWLTGLMRVMRFTVSVLDQAHEDILALCRGRTWWSCRTVLPARPRQTSWACRQRA